MEEYMNICIEQAKIAAENGDVPIGAVIVQNGKVLCSGYNTREKEHNVLGHAEINVILKASKELKRWNLSDCDLYVTLKPCSMCNIIIQQARIRNVFYLLDKLDYKKEYNKTQYVILDSKKFENIEQMYSSILSSFFQDKRK